MKVLGLKNKSEITIRTKNANYLSADRNHNNQILANRATFGVWEKFTIHILSNNTVAFQTSDFSFIGSNTSRDGQLFAGYEKTNSHTIFSIIEMDSGKVVLKAANNKFVYVNLSGQLHANEINEVNAAQFSIQATPQAGFSYFSTNQLMPLFTAALLLLMSLILFQYKENKKLSIVLLLLGGFSIRLFVALLNSHLTLWDEQFHALVAKNMMDHPFTPMLYKTPLLPYDANNWTAGHIWLHKQPLFLWQMAISMKLFGVNIFGLRLPSVIMSTIIIYFIYKIGSLTVNKTTGYFGALLFALSNFALELTAGAIHTDHNDVAFLFYVVASIWAWVEYESAELKRKKTFLILIGVFSGCAVLVKWLTGFLVFSGWGLSVLLSKERRKEWTNYTDLLISFGIALLIFGPWQIYILNAFPDLSRFEYSLNSKHFSEVVEGHGGDFWWHFNIAKSIYGVSPLFLVLCVSVFYLSIRNKTFKVAFLSYLLLIYVFFGIAATKMIAFTYSVSFLIYLSMGGLIAAFFEFVILKSGYVSNKLHYVIYTCIILAFISALNLNIESIQEQHTLFKKQELSYLTLKLKSTPAIKDLSDKIDDIKNCVVFNCKAEDNVPLMFFNDIVAAYTEIPDSNTSLKIQQKGYRIAVFENSALPSYLVHDKKVLKLAGY